ncbi:MAG: hypothetical protein U0401_07890 [Anaerolineae bacterium]
MRFLSRNYNLFLVSTCAVFIFSLAYFAPVDDYRSDPWLTLLTPQAMISHQTFYIDWYKDYYSTEEAKEQRYYADFDTNRRIVKQNEHYYHYSIGTGVISVPFVGVANLLGKSMLIPEDETVTQNFISALSCAVIFLVAYHICRAYVSFTASLVIAAISVLGSSLISIMGVALWNFNFTAIFNGLILLHLVHYESGKIKSINLYWLGLLIFLAYFCRPTAAFLGIAVFIYLFFRFRKLFLWGSVLALLVLPVLAAYLWFWREGIFPAYYSPAKLLSNLSSVSFIGFYGNLLSPSRGLFTFSPFLIPVLGASIWFFPQLKRYPLFWVCLLWYGMHLVAISTRPVWWAGHTYGPRFSTDVIPAFMPITALIWREASQLASLPAQRIWGSGYITLGILGILIHSYQGLYNPYTIQWNKHPNVNNYHNYLLSWRYPQFLASKELLAKRNLERFEEELSLYGWGNPITYEGEFITFTDNAYVGSHAILEDWHKAEAGWRWSAGASPRIIFKLETVDSKLTYAVEILSASLTNQEVAVLINQTEVGRIKLTAFTGDKPNPHQLLFDGKNLQANHLNEVTFRLPDAPISTDWNSRTQGLAFVQLKLFPVK